MWFFANPFNLYLSRELVDPTVCPFVVKVCQEYPQEERWKVSPGQFISFPVTNPLLIKFVVCNIVPWKIPRRNAVAFFLGGCKRRGAGKHIDEKKQEYDLLYGPVSQGLGTTKFTNLIG